VLTNKRLDQHIPMNSVFQQQFVFYYSMVTLLHPQ